MLNAKLAFGLELVMLLMPYVQTTATTVFKRWEALHPNQTSISGSHTSKSKGRCASDCLRKGNECLAFGYSDETKTCKLMNCFNMEALIEGQGDIYTDVSLTSSHLLAQGKTVTLSSLFKAQYPGSSAVDGIYDQDYNLAHTAEQDNPWLRIDLGSVHCIWAVRILNRGNAYAITWQDLRDIQIKVGLTESDLSSDSSLCFFYPGSLEQFYTVITCSSPMTGQWVQMMKLVTAGTMSLPEIEVHGL